MKLILAIILASLALVLSSSVLLCEEERAYYDEARAFNLERGVYIAMNKPSFKYGRMIVTSNTISWRNGPKDIKYRITEKGRDRWVGEFLEPLPTLEGVKYRYMIWGWLEPALGCISIELSNKLAPADDDTALWFSYAPLHDMLPIKPLDEADVKLVINRLNQQGKLFGFGEKRDDVFWYHEDGSFGIADTGNAAWYLYKADINNDNEYEYVLASSQGSGAFFDIEAVYKDKNGQLYDIYDEIRIPMRKLIRDAQNGSYDLEDGCVDFMNGDIDIESVNGKVYFTLHRTTRDYDIDDYKRSFQPPEFFKLLWFGGQIKLADSKVNDKQI